MKFIVFLFLFISQSGIGISQGLKPELPHLLTIPLHYTVLKTSEKIFVDGKDSEEAWNRALWTESFVDIKGESGPKPKYRTQCKMLWDENYLYLFAKIEETDIWASVTEHDKSVFQDNAFEIFIDPDGNANDYFEFQINALETVWDLFLTKPYRNGGKGLSSWDIKGLRKSVHLNGTINNATDVDSSWCIELAIPFTSISFGHSSGPTVGTIWRMNFSRVEWETDTTAGKYNRKRDASGKLKPEQYTVWSPQGIVNLHYPERWGYVQFSDKDLSRNFLSEGDENIKLQLWRYYYLQQDFMKNHEEYAQTLNRIDTEYPQILPSTAKNIFEMEATQNQFLIQCSLKESNIKISVNQNGQFISTSSMGK